MWNMINNYIKNIVISLGYNILYLFSYLQIKYDNYTKKICYTDTSNYTYANSDELFMDVEIYNVSNIINRRIKNDDIQNDDIQNEKYDCIIISNNKSDRKSEKLIIQNYIKFPNELKWECTNKYFLSLLIILKSGEVCNIMLESKKYNYNYRIVGNIIDDIFIKYYLKKYNNNIIHKNISYRIELIGPTFEILNLEMDKKIILEKDGYSIKDN